MSTANRKYKDSVFVDLFSEDEKAKENFLSLYNALHNTNLPLSCPVENIRLDNVMYMNIINDVSCLVDNKIIVLAEHQSTINENMPLRFLQYIARLYEKLQAPTDRYLRKLSKIPTPEFYVFYNGKQPCDTDTRLQLSNSFTQKQDYYALELSVKVININYDTESRILKHCKALEQYSLFVDAVRRNIALDREHGFEKAIKECIKKDILKDYLQRKSKEVINMLIGEYDYDTDIAVQRAEEREIAFAEGIQQGISQGIEQGSYQKALETAKLMKQANCETHFIMQMTKLREEEIEEL